MNAKLERTLQQCAEYLEENHWLEIVLGGLVVLLVVAVIFVWDPLQVLNPSPPIQVVALAGPVQINEEQLAELVAGLKPNEAIYFSGNEDGSWYCVFADGTFSHIAIEDQVPEDQRAVLHPYQRICRKTDGRWKGCPSQPY